MIDRTLFDSFRLNGSLYYTLYSAPVDDIIILGNDSTVKALIFKQSFPVKGAFTRNFKKGVPESISNTIKFLDTYFSGRRCKGRNGMIRSALKYEVKNQTLMVTCNEIILHLDLTHFSDKEIAVYRELLKVPAGSTISYGHLARLAGIPRGGRFVGNTMAKNVFPVVIPCHRVIKSDGSLGNYSGGVHIKKYLLDHEKN